MDNSEYFKDIIESIHDYKIIVMLLFLIQNDKNLLKEVGFSKKNNQLSVEFKKILFEEFDDYLSYIKKRRRIYYRKIFE